MRPTPQAVREAAEALKKAIDAHLFAVETRLGDSDVAVELAYREIRSATEHYDQLLLQAYNEVTPFMFMDAEVEQGEFDELGLARGQSFALPGVVSVLMRRDYAVIDHDQVMASGQEAYTAARDAQLPMFEDHPPQNMPSALYAMFQVAGVDGLDNAAGHAGLATLGGAIWFMSGDDPQLVDVNTAFDGIDEEKVIFRVHEVPEGPVALEENPQILSAAQVEQALLDAATQAAAPPPPSRTVRTAWSFDTDTLPTVGGDPQEQPRPYTTAASAARPEHPGVVDPLDTTQAFTWHEDEQRPPTDQAQQGHHEQGHPEQSYHEQTGELPWDPSMFREEHPQDDPQVDQQYRPSWDPDDPLGDGRPRRRRTD